MSNHILTEDMNFKRFLKEKYAIAVDMLHVYWQNNENGTEHGLDKANGVWNTSDIPVLYNRLNEYLAL